MEFVEDSKITEGRIGWFERQAKIFIEELIKDARQGNNLAEKARESIERFEGLELKSLSLTRIESELSKVFGSVFNLKKNINDKGLNIGIIPCMSGIHSRNALFFRVRICTLGIEQEIKNISHCWEAPSSAVKQRGRFNHRGQGLLYTARDMKTCIEEGRISDNNEFALLIYKAKTEINTRLVQFPFENNWPKNFPDEFKGVFLAIAKFIEREVCKVASIGEEYIYKTTNILVNKFLPLDSVVKKYDAWEYPSAANNQYNLNICFDREGRNKLELLGVAICEVDRVNKNGQFKIKKFGRLDTNEDITYLEDIEPLTSLLDEYKASEVSQSR